MVNSPSCPICHKPHSLEGSALNPFRPFCSERCKLIDLGSWLDGSYKISRPLTETDLDGADNFLGLEPGDRKTSGSDN
jgi:uncharacterized protein